MGKQKQQIISRFFAPKPKSATTSPSPPPPPKPSQPTIPPKIATTVSFSPSKRKLLSTHITSSSKKPKLNEPSKQNPKQQQPPTKYTPLEQQVIELKSKYLDVLLMIEVGYKYRFFGDDAEIASKVLGIYAHVDHNFMTASIPTFRLNVHVRRLVNAGHKVGVVKQTETAAIKAHGDNKTGPFCRGLSALYTKATLEAAEGLGGESDECGGESNYLCCVVENVGFAGGHDCGFDTRIGVVAVEVSAGDVVYSEFEDVFIRSRLEALLLSLAPAELLLGCPLSKQTEKLLLAYAGPASNVRVEHVSQDCLKEGGSHANVVSLFESMDKDDTRDNEEHLKENTENKTHNGVIEGIMNMPDLAVQALTLMIHHLKQFGLQRILCLGPSFRPFSGNTEMNLSANTLQQLEVLKNNSDGSESGSLLHMMNHTHTVYGSRLLRHWVTHPLCNRTMISTRLDAVSEIAESFGSCSLPSSAQKIVNEESSAIVGEPDLSYLLSNVLNYLGSSRDIQRGITRIFHRTANATEFIAVMEALLHAGKQLQRFNIMDEQNVNNFEEKAIKSVLLRKLILTASSSTVVNAAAKLLSSLSKEAAEQGDLSNLILISDRQFPEVEAAREAVELAQNKLDSLITVYRKQLGMRNLEFASVSGITNLVELPVDFRVPSDWLKINSTKKMIRYHPPEVSVALEQLSLAKEELLIVCQAAWNSFLGRYAKHYAEFYASIQALAALDCLYSLAILSRTKNYVRPLFVDENESVRIHICDGRHPVLETILQDNFVPNDTHLDADIEYCQIITGPNMGGKSCYIRQVALIAMMAQVGSFVPASSAKLHVLDGIYTRMGASDSIQKGRSTFLEELSEASYILQSSTSHSLVIIDELGRGTSTHDGVAIAYATLHHLLSQKRCSVLFVTHYPKIADIRAEFPGSVGAYHVSYLTTDRTTMGVTDSKYDNDDVTYLYKLVPGISERSFGFKVAQLAQLPTSCVKRAKIMAERLERAVASRKESKLPKEQLLKTLTSNKETHEKTMDAPEAKLSEKNEDVTGKYREILMNLKHAISENEMEKSVMLLVNARTIAKQLLNL